MAAARSWKPRSVDTNGLLARNFGRGPGPTEAAIGVAVLNRMLGAGRPDSVRSSKKTA